MALDGEVRRVEVAGATVAAVTGDITVQDVDALVNAANERLQHGGGVAAALAKAGGPAIQEESDAWVEAHGRLAPGTAAVTSAGDMPASCIVHVAGPVYDEDSGDNEPRLRDAVAAALDAADAAGTTSIAFPAISAGTFGYPRQEATTVIAAEVRSWLQRSDRKIEEVRLVGFDEATADDFAAALAG